MSKNIYRSALGKAVDLDALRLANEEAVAVGNMKVNARGDELGPGGSISKPKRDVMNDYYKSNAIYTEESIEDVRRNNARAGARLTAEGPDPDVFHNPVPNNARKIEVPAEPDPLADELAAEDARVNETAVEPAGKQLRGSLADAVAKTATINQDVLKPKSNKPSGPSRI